MSHGLMPCGPLQAMQLYSLSAGSFFKGALAMFLFALGTVPLIFFSGALINLTRGRIRVIIGEFATMLVLVLSVSMMNRGLLGLGADLSGFSLENRAFRLFWSIRLIYSLLVSGKDYV